MARFANGRTTAVLGWLTISIILSLNGLLIWQIMTGS
jgi:Mn2+/Fe2+ NRAMP family transporter